MLIYTLQPRCACRCRDYGVGGRHLSRAQPRFDLIILGGMLFDGSGSPARRADVGVRGDSIVDVGDLVCRDCDSYGQWRGLVVSPGFIDMHSHSDYSGTWWTVERCQR